MFTLKQCACYEKVFISCLSPCGWCKARRVMVEQAENIWARSRVFRRLRHQWLAETFASTARGLSWFLSIHTTTGYVSREQSFFTTTETTKTTKRKKIAAGYLTLLRLQRAWTMPNYTQGAAALYPGLCSSALTARAGQYIFCEQVVRVNQEQLHFGYIKLYTILVYIIYTHG